MAGQDDRCETATRAQPHVKPGRRVARCLYFRHPATSMHEYYMIQNQRSRRYSERIISIVSRGGLMAESPGESSPAGRTPAFARPEQGSTGGPLSVAEQIRQRLGE